MSIDLAPYFSPEALQTAFVKLIESKTDQYSDIINIKMGADGINLEDFKKNIDRNVAEISRKVISGNYFFYPLRERNIRKDKTDPSKGTRTLSIATIRDTLVQKQLYEALYNRFEMLFAIPTVDKVSVAYRKGKTTHDAIRNIWYDYHEGYDYALDADLSKFFDTVNHTRLETLLNDLVGDSPIAFNLLKRYMRTSFVKHETYEHRNLSRYFMENKPPRTLRTIGVPQGGVLSGMLANLYLHSFDRWLVENMGKHYNLRYYRYADDFVVLTKTIEDAQSIYYLVKNYISDIQLELHPLDVKDAKTRLVSIKQEGLDFLGFRITKDEIEIKHKNIARFKKGFLDSIYRIEKPKFSIQNSTKRLEILIKYFVNTKIAGPDNLCPNCQKPITHRNWISYFAPVITNMHQIHDLDVWMRKSIRHLLWEKFKMRTQLRDYTRYGMTSLMKEFRRCHDIKLCSCELELEKKSPKTDSDAESATPHDS